MNADQLAVLRRTVAEFDGCVVGSPAEVVADGRDVAADWADRGWPATGMALVDLLNRSATELATAGLLACHTPPGPGQPEWLAVSDLTVPARSDHKLPTSTDPGSTATLTGKVAAVAAWLAAESGTWTGPADDFRSTWKRISEQGRPAGPPWCRSVEALTTALAVAGPELAPAGHRRHRGPRDRLRSSGEFLRPARGCSVLSAVLAGASVDPRAPGRRPRWPARCSGRQAAGRVPRHPALAHR